MEKQNRRSIFRLFAGGALFSALPLAGKKPKTLDKLPIIIDDPRAEEILPPQEIYDLGSSGYIITSRGSSCNFFYNGICGQNASVVLREYSFDRKIEIESNFLYNLSPNGYSID